ncbi:hypothetical protein JCM21900_001359 [Sporobolomyces salmonicolor]
MLPSNAYVRWGSAVLLVLLFLHLIASISSPSYAHHVSLDRAKERLGFTQQPAELWYAGKQHRPWDPTPQPWRSDVVVAASGNGTEAGGLPQQEKVKAAFVVLARNSDLWELLDSMRGMEDRFNNRYQYDWVMLNDEPFSDEFKRHTSGIASGTVKYGLVPEEHWGKDMPSWIDKDEALRKIGEMGQKQIPYAGSIPYRKMCRFQSGFFWRHPLLDDYEYYWRVEPNVKFFCNLDYDPFLMMKQQHKKYGFVVSLYEYRETIESLWSTTKEFIDTNPQFLAKPNMMDWVSNDGGETYNLCHYWSNFEIASLDFWRSEAYRAYFDHLDKAGGFFYERWGDAPVHSIAASLFLRPDELHFFQDIGYRHEPFQHCPQAGYGDQCACNPRQEENFEFHGYSCTPRWKEITHYTRGNLFVSND